jgi:ankyrin repeat protein
VEARPLPPRPNLEQYKKQAKGLLKACTSADPQAIHVWAGQWLEACADLYVETEARLRGIVVTQALRESIEREEVNRIEKNLFSKPLAQLADAQFFIAREHGFESWPKFATQVRALERGNSRDARFEAAADAVVSGDIRTLERLLHEDPQLIRTRSQRTHNAPLLHYVAANGVEDFRQKTPENIVQIAKQLLDAGAEVNAESSAYGGGSTALGLVATSVHPERAGVQEELMQLLLDHGARLDLETAARVGRLDVVQSYFSEPDATKEKLQRGFLWACEHGHNQVADFLLARGADLLDQANTGQTALHWAVVGGELSTIKLLLERGAPLEERNAHGGTALGRAGWSLFNGDPEIDYVPIFETLLGAGARIEDGWLAWLDGQEGRPAVVKARIAEVLRRFGAVT